MTTIHAGNKLHLAKPGECARYWPQAFGVYLWCGELVLPGEDECAEHYIEKVAEAPYVGNWIVSADGAYLHFAERARARRAATRLNAYYAETNTSRVAVLYSRAQWEARTA